jgi:outer membrane protein assembly factor BamB
VNDNKAWVRYDRHQGAKTVHVKRPDGRLSWSTEEVPLIGELPDPGKYVYVIEVTYSTGSTFNSESGLKTVAAVCATDTEAVKVLNAIDKNAKKRPPRYSINVLDTEIECNTWTGYFESIDYTSIELVPVVE